MLKHRITVVSALAFLTAALLAYSAGAQPATCPAGEPPCKNQTPMAGHGAAKDLPASFNCQCPSDERRVITLSIDSTWNVTDASGTHPNSNIETALNCAIDQWNRALDQNGNTTQYRLVYDQAGAIATTADITLTNQTPSGGGGFAETTTTYPFSMRLAPANGNLGGGTFTADDLCGRIAHEIGHKLGLAEVTSACNSIMDGVNPDGTRDVNHLQTNDVQQVRNNFNPVTRTNGTCTAPGTDHEDSGGGDPGGGCGSDPCCSDPECCGDPNCGDQWCSIVCDYECSRYCDDLDEFGHCNPGGWSPWECGSTDCHQECY